MGGAVMPGLNWISAAVGAAASVAVIFGVVTAWSQLVTIPDERAEAAALAEAAAAERTENAIGEISSDAEKARFMRRYCRRDSGRLYDFEHDRCREH